MGKNRTRRMWMTVFSTLMMGMGAFVAVPTASAAGSSEGSDELTCTVTATGDGFDVAWDSTLDEADRYVVSRRVFDRFHWRGRTAGSERDFVDGPMPRTAAAIRYQVTALSDGAELGQADCTIVDSSGFSCSQATLANGGYEVTWSGLPSAGGGVDYVVRRQVVEDGPLYWRGHTTDVSRTDIASPTGQASYVVIGRVDGFIVAAADCSDGEDPGPDPECEPFRQVGSQVSRQFPVTGPDGEVTFVSNELQIVRTTNGATGTVELAELPHPGVVASVTSGGSALLSVDDPATGREPWWFDAGTGEVFPIADISPTGESLPGPGIEAADGTVYFAAYREFTSDRSIFAFRPATRDLTEVVRQNDFDFFLSGELVLAPDGRVFFDGRLVDGPEGRGLFVYDPADGSVERVGDFLVSQLLFAPDGSLYFGQMNDNGNFDLWTYNPSDGTANEIFAATDVVTSVGAFSNAPDGRLFFSEVDERSFGNLWVYDPAAGTVTPVATPNDFAPSDAVFPGDGNGYLTSTNNGFQTFWTFDLATLSFTVIEDGPVQFNAQLASAGLVLLSSRGETLLFYDTSCR